MAHFIISYIKFKILTTNNRLLQLCAGFVLLSSLQCAQLPKAQKKDTRPNIVIIMADDLGFSDIGCYGGEIQTPNIDRLADNGVRFTNFYNVGRCCPTRAALLTGLYNQEAGIGNMTNDQHKPGFRGYLTENTVTLAEVLKMAGYNTAMSGKWHVSNTVTRPTPKEQLDWLNHQSDYQGPFSPLEQYPLNRGFDKFYGTIWGVVDYFDPFSLVNGLEPVREVPKDYYHTDAINDTAASYIRQMSKENKPFFLYVAQNAAHWPLMAKPEDIKKYEDTYKVGWEAIREARYNKMVQMGLIDAKTAPLPPRWQEGLAWKDNPDTAWDARAMAVHAAMIDCMDQGIGRILTALEQTGELDNTLILFLSDNGASAEWAANYGPGFDRPSETRDGKKIFYAKNKEVMPGPQTSYTSIGPRWANVSNTPYRYWKSWSYEGGVHTPMIAFWPKGIQMEKGSFTRQTGHVMDFMPTLLEIAHAQYPETYKGHQISPMEGVSLATILKGQQSVDYPTLFNEHEGGRYARQGQWKLVAPNNGKKQWHLYNLDEDHTELKDLAGQHPEKVRELEALWTKWATRMHIIGKK